MRGFLSLFIIILFFSFSMATVPPKNGGPLPPSVRKFTEEMQSFYPQGNLPRLMQKWAHQKQLNSETPNALNKANDVVSYKFPVLVGKYSDATDVQEDAPQQLQKELFDGPWPTQTMREFYLENSYNQFELSGTVYGWVPVANPESYYTGPDGTYGMSGYARKFVIELLDSVDSYVNFADFDNDGDGVVETVIIVHSGPGQEYYGSNSVQNHIWSHSSSLGDYYVTNDVNSNGKQVKIYRYIIQPAINSDKTVISIGVFCHEFGHALGLPDLYDTGYNSEGIGDWGLMGGGSWNTPSSPSHFSAWSKEALGWLKPVVLDEDQELTSIPPVETTPVVYKLWNVEGLSMPYTIPYGARVNGGRQYFLVENRQRIGSDKNLHAPGMLIWHVDNTVTSGNRIVTHKLVDLEEADGLDQLDNNQSAGDGGDVYPGTTGNTVFDYSSTPNSRAYNLADSKVAVTDVLEENDQILAKMKIGMIKYEITAMNLMEPAETADGIYQPGEQVKLWMKIKNNTSSDVNDLNMELTSMSRDMSVENNVVSFGTIATQGTADDSSNAFVLNIRPDAVPQTVRLQLRMTNGDGYEKITQMDFVIGIPEFLVIDQDRSTLSMSSFRTMLDNGRVAFQVLNPLNADSTAFRFSHRNIIAVIGGNNPEALTDTTLQDSLEAWMTTGKGLLVIAPQGAASLTDSAFSQGFLHIRYDKQATTLLMKGVSGDALGFGGKFLYIQDGDYETVKPMNGATASVNFIGTTNGGLVHFEDSDNNKIVYSTFDLRAIKDNSPVKQDQIFTGIMDWFSPVTGIAANQNTEVPSGFTLQQNYPNPFNPETSIRYYLPATREKVTLKIYNSVGQLVNEFDLSRQPIGWNVLKWNGLNSDGHQVGSGLYFYQLRSGNFRATRKMLLMK